MHVIRLVLIPTSLWAGYTTVTAKAVTVEKDQYPSYTIVHITRLLINSLLHQKLRYCWCALRYVYTYPIHLDIYQERLLSAGRAPLEKSPHRFPAPLGLAQIVVLCTTTSPTA